jgi:hypothetical protein
VVLSLPHGRGWVDQGIPGSEVTFHLRDGSTKSADASRAGDDAVLSCAAVSGDARTLIAGFGGRGVLQWTDSSSDATHRPSIRAGICDLSEDSAWLAVADDYEQGPVGWWNVATGRRARELGEARAARDAVRRTALVVTQDDWIIVSVHALVGRGLGARAPIEGWSADGENSFALDLHGAASSLAVSPDGRWLAVATADTRIHVVDLLESRR